MTHILLIVLRSLPVQQRVFALQTYIAEHGPVPNEIGDEVRRLLVGSPS